MKKILLIIFTFALVSSKLTSSSSIIYGVNTTIDENNMEFTLNYNGRGKDILLLYLSYEGSLFVNYSCGTKGYKNQTYSNAGEDLILMTHYDKKSTCRFKYNPEKGQKYSFVMYSMNTPVKIKLKNKYGNLKTPRALSDFNTNITNLTFIVQNLEKDVNATFEFNKTSAKMQQIIFTIKNPFTVCEDKNCQSEVSSYVFKKGKTYFIQVNYMVYENFLIYYGIPGFTFYNQDYDGNYYEDDVILNGVDGLTLKYLLICLMLLFI